MDFGFQLPDVVFELPEQERRHRIRGRSKVFVLDDEVGFVRVVLPVQLDHGSVTFGIWLETSAEQADHAARVWEEPAYASLVLSGRVANFLAPWGAALLGAAATARPLDGDALPFVTGGADIIVSLLEERWPRQQVVDALPGLGHTHADGS